MRALVTAGAVIAFGLGMSGCSGNGYSSGNGNPTGPTSPPSNSGVVWTQVILCRAPRVRRWHSALATASTTVSIHPVMIGSVNQETAPLPCQGPYCY